MLISAGLHIHITANAKQLADELDLGVRRTVTILENIFCADRIFGQLGRNIAAAAIMCFPLTLPARYATPAAAHHSWALPSHWPQMIPRAPSTCRTGDQETIAIAHNPHHMCELVDGLRQCFRWLHDRTPWPTACFFACPCKEILQSSTQVLAIPSRLVCKIHTCDLQCLICCLDALKMRCCPLHSRVALVFSLIWMKTTDQSAVCRSNLRQRSVVTDAKAHAGIIRAESWSCHLSTE